MLPVDLYESESFISHGTIGATYKARKVGETQELAVKIVSLAKAKNDTRANLIRAVRSLKGIVHRNILTYTNIYASNLSLFIEMKLMEGRSLSDYLLLHRRHGSIPEAVIRDIIHQLAAGLDYLHRGHTRQIVHGNLVPRNIFYDNGTIFIADYGLYLPLVVANSLGCVATRYPPPPEFRGNPFNSSEEVISAYTDKADIWLLGNLIIELCTYETNAVTPLDIQLSEYSPAIKDMVTECLRQDPSQRPTAADLAIRTQVPEVEISTMTSIRTSSALSLGTFTQMNQVLYKEISLCKDLIMDAQISKDIDHQSCTSRIASPIYFNSEATITEHPRTSYHDFFLVQALLPAVSLMVAQHVQNDNLVYLEILNTKLTSARMVQRYKHNISQVHNNPSANVIKINHFEQISDWYICEMEYTNAPTLQTVINEYRRAGTTIPEEFIWSVLLDICTSLLHLQSIGASYGLLLPASIFIRDSTAVIASFATSYLIYRSDKNGRTRMPLHGMIELILWMTNLSVPKDVSLNNIGDTQRSTYSHDLLNLIKTIEKATEEHSVLSPVEHLTAIRTTALEHARRYSINPFTLGAPKQLLALINSDNQDGLEKHITRFNSCPPGALVSAVSRRRLDSMYTMCRAMSKRGLSTRIPICSGIKVCEPTPLMKAVWQDDAHSIKLSKDHLMACYNGITALMLSAHEGKYTCLTNLLLEMGIQSWSGTTALMFAADRGHENCVRLLLPEMGIQRHDGMTALMFATQRGNTNLVKLLFQERDLRNSAGCTAYDIAVDKGFEDCIKILAQPEMIAVHPKSPKKTEVSQSIIRGDSRNILPPGRFSNLMLAASSNDITSIKKYIHEEAALTNIEGKTALMFAAELGNTAAVRKLARVEGGMLTTTGEAAIFMAIRNNNHDCVAILRQYEEELTNEFGETPAQFADRLGYKSCAAALTTTIPSPWSSLEQHTDLTESRGRLSIISQESSLHFPRQSSKSSRIQQEMNHDLMLKQEALSNKVKKQVALSAEHVDNSSSKPCMTSRDAIQDIIELCTNQVSQIAKDNNESKQEQAQAQILSIRENLINPSAKSEYTVHVEDTTTETLDASEQPPSMRHSFEDHVELPDSHLASDACCGSAVQTKSSVEKGREQRLIKIGGKKDKSNKARNNKIYIAKNDSDSISSSESALADEDVSVDIDAELAKGIDLIVHDRKGISLETAHRRKSKKPRASKAKTKLMLAVENNDQESFKLYLKTDAKKAYNGLTALMLAVESNNLLFIHILSYYENAFGQHDGTTALMMATERGLTEAVCVLIEKEAGVLDKRGNTALLRLLESPLPHACVQLLAKAEGRIARKDGQTPLMVALEKGGHQDIMELLPFGTGQTNKAGQTALMIAAINGRADYVERLMPSEGGMSDKKGMTALMYAAAAGSTDCVKMLVNREKGMQTKQKWTALHYAVENNRVECVKLLLFAVEDVPNVKGQRCLAIAKMKYFHECVRLLSREISES